MSKKKWCGLLAILMAVSIVFTSGALRPVNVYAETIADLQEQSEEHQKKLEEINQQIEEAEANKADALEQKKPAGSAGGRPPQPDLQRPAADRCAGGGAGGQPAEGGVPVRPVLPSGAG